MFEFCSSHIEIVVVVVVVVVLFLFAVEDVVIEFTVLVNEDSAPPLTSGREKLEDILVLHLEKGKDFFITVSGNYLPSCFGSSLETLVNLHTYIREVPVARLIDLVREGYMWRVGLV